MTTLPKQTPLSYLMKELNGFSDFMMSWKGLDQKDKDELKQYAEEEMKQ